ncbi:MAG: cobyrinate a,c-diamide synthase [Firmicutes bacterium]|nr:cobyrinate a,c-diamide synthase [Bacillota bacterium]
MAKTTIPRILIAGSGSGCGKTTVSCALMQALTDRGLEVAPFKCGPDYIDPMFHGRICGKAGSNLDSYFFDGDTLKYALAKNGKGRGISVIEGVMGYYDGLGLASLKASTSEIAGITKTPVILVVDAKGASLSVEAVIKGFLDFTEDSGIKGVILNRCSQRVYEVLAEDIGRRFEGRVKPLGFMPFMKDCGLESRHLGLVTAAEVEDLSAKLEKLGAQAEISLDIDGIIGLAGTAPALEFEPPALSRLSEGFRIGVALDKAFCFYYEDSLQVLRDLGAETVYFSPLEDSALPEGLDGLYLGGGYPELYAEALSSNASMLSSVRKALDSGLPCIAECGGFMYLTEAIGGFPMAGVIKGKSFDSGRLSRFGYAVITAKEDNMLCKKGESIRAHEFHRWDSEDCGAGFTAEKADGRTWDCVFSGPALYAGYPHFHFLANPVFALGFARACIKEKHRHERDHQPR